MLFPERGAPSEADNVLLRRSPFCRCIVAYGLKSKLVELWIAVGYLIWAYIM
jgi:hypothetical protein